MSDHICTQEALLRNISVDVGATRAKLEAMDKRINGSIDDFRVHVEHGGKWRTLIATIGFALICNIVVFAYMFGQLNKTVLFNERFIQKFTEKYEVIILDTELDQKIGENHA